MVGKNSLQEKNEYKDGGVFYGLFLAPKKVLFNYKKIWCYRRTKKTFKGLTNVSDSLDRKKYFKMFNGDKLISKVPLSWKKSFIQRVVIPQKIKNCIDCKKDILCCICGKLVNQRKEFSANLNEKKNDKRLLNLVICYQSV